MNARRLTELGFEALTDAFIEALPDVEPFDGMSQLETAACCALAAAADLAAGMRGPDRAVELVAHALLYAAKSDHVRARAALDRVLEAAVSVDAARAPEAEALGTALLATLRGKE